MLKIEFLMQTEPTQAIPIADELIHATWDPLQALQFRMLKVQIYMKGDDEQKLIAAFRDAVESVQNKLM